MRLDDDYAAAVTRLMEVGALSAAGRFAARRGKLECTPMSRAIMAAVDAVDCRRAAVLDPAHARRWQAISRDQSRLARERLDAFLGARCER